MAEDVKSHALDSSHDFYALLEIPPAASEPEIRTAYRKTARKYHPDKVGANAEALEKFHLLQIAYDVLSSATARELYDNARRAREDKARRDEAYSAGRKRMKEDLERRERDGGLGLKRKQPGAEEEFEQELARLAEDGRRRRKEREEQLRKEALELVEQTGGKKDEAGATPPQPKAQGNGVADVDRSITFRFPQSDATKDIDRAEIVSRFSRFGAVEEAVLREKKVKVDGEKHRQVCTIVVLLFKSIVSAHAAISDLPKACKEDEKLRVFESIAWAGGREPDCIPKASGTPSSRPANPLRESVSNATTPSTPLKPGDGKSGPGLKTVPSFSSFKGTPRGHSSPGFDEITMMRLKNAERRRMEERIRREEAAEAAAEEASKLKA